MPNLQFQQMDVQIFLVLVATSSSSMASRLVSWIEALLEIIVFANTSYRRTTWIESATISSPVKNLYGSSCAEEYAVHNDELFRYS